LRLLSENNLLDDKKVKKATPSIPLFRGMFKNSFSFERKRLG
jgi:hypothetical protein